LASFLVGFDMAKNNFIVEGLRELMDHVHKLPANIGSRAKGEFNDFAEKVIEESQQLVPYDPDRKSGTHLRDAKFIRKATNDFRPTVWLGYSGKKAPHAWLVENDIAGKHKASHYSTPSTGPKFLERPFLARKADLVQKIDKVIEEELRK
jgi:hypothetical protein